MTSRPAEQGRDDPAAHDALATSVGPLRLRSPLLTASGTFNLKADLSGVLDLGRLGGIVTKTVTPRKRLGNPVCRVAEVPAGMLNSIGLMNEGFEGFLEKEFASYRGIDSALIINIGGDDADDFAEMARRFGAMPDVDALEINVSCPNVKHGTAVFAACPEATAEVVERCAAETDKPLWVKLSPESARIGQFAVAAAEAGATAVTVANSWVAMAVDWRKRRPILGRGKGGYTGPGVKPLTLRLIHEVAQATTLPIVGVGGAETAEDVMEFLVAGASAVQIGTAYLRDPSVFMRVDRDLRALIERERLGRLEDWIGTLRAPGEETTVRERREAERCN